MEQRQVFRIRDVPAQLIIKTLNKMTFTSMMRTRRTNSWLHNFVDQYRRQVHVTREIESVTVGAEAFSRYSDIYQIRFKKDAQLQPIPRKAREADLCALRPKQIVFQAIFRRRQLTSETLEQQFSFLQRMNWLSHAIVNPQHFDFEHRFMPAFLTLAQKYGVQKIDISQGDSRTDISNHPLLYEARCVHINFYGPHDLSFILAPRRDGEIKLRISQMTLESMTNIKKLFKLMAEGKVGTRLFQLKGFLHIKDLNLNASFLVDGIKDITLFWSYEIHNQSTIAHENMDYRNRSFLERIYYSVPLPNGKIGGICVSEDGGDLVQFKIYDKIEDYTQDLCLKN